MQVLCVKILYEVMHSFLMIKIYIVFMKIWSLLHFLFNYRLWKGVYGRSKVYKKYRIHARCFEKCEFLPEHWLKLITCKWKIKLILFIYFFSPSESQILSSLNKILSNFQIYCSSGYAALLFLTGLPFIPTAGVYLMLGKASDQTNTIMKKNNP